MNFSSKKLLEIINDDDEKLSWSSEKEVVTLINSLIYSSSSKNILEIGTYRGFTTIQIAENLEEDAGIWSLDIKDFFSKYLNKLNKKVSNKIHFSKMDIVAFYNLKDRPRSFDFIFIDAEHGFKNSFNDFSYGLQMSKDNTYILFHDYMSNMFEGPRKTVKILKIINFIFLNSFFEFISIETRKKNTGDNGFSGLALVKVKAKGIFLSFIKFLFSFINYFIN